MRVAVLAVPILGIAGCGDTSETSAARTLNRHQRHRNAATERCLERCQRAFGPGDTDLSSNNCEAQCYPYLVDTDQIREEIEVREDERAFDPDSPRPTRRGGDPLAPVAPPEPEYETEHYD